MTPNCPRLSAALCLVAALAAPAPAQSTTDSNTRKQKSSAPARPAPTDSAPASAADPAREARRATATGLLVSLAAEARDFRDATLRARVQGEAADLLWVAERERARSLFQRAWEAARAADRDNERRRDEEIERQLREGGTATTADLPNLRAEVLRLVGRRDPALSEEFLKSLEADKGATEDDASTAPRERSGGGHSPNESTPAEGQRLKLARELLDEGDAERAFQTAAPALARVTRDGTFFLSRLRAKLPAQADARFGAMLARAAADPASDANTVSLLSSYAYTPGIFVMVMNGGGSGTEVRESLPAPALAPALRAAFFRTAAQVLLRPLPPPAEDRSTSGRYSVYVIASRLLPLFEQHAPEHAALVSARIAGLRQELPEQLLSGVSPNLLTHGLATAANEPGAPPPTPDSGPRVSVGGSVVAPPQETADEMLARIDKATLRGTDAGEREMLYVRAAMQLSSRGDVRAREFAAKVEDANLRRRLREYVDFELVRGARAKGDVGAAVELARAGELPPLKRAWALSDLAHTLMKTDAARAVELLEEAGGEARRAEPGDPARAQALTAVATRLFEVDRPRAWFVLSEVVKAANSAEGFTGQDGRFFIELRTKNFATASERNIPEFDLAGLFRLLAADDLGRAVEFARAFQHESARAAATLALARAVLEEKAEGRKSGNSY